MPQEREFDFTEKDFRFLAGLARDSTGIVLPDQKKDMVYGRLVRRLRALNLQSFGQYCDVLQSPAGEGEMVNLVNAITTNLTGFYREAHHFVHLAEVLQATASPRRLRIWSAGCSSGMEPYSIAMTVATSLRGLPRCDARILATDIDSNMLDIGQRGEYRSEDVAAVPAACRHLFDDAGAGRVAMGDKLRALVTFRQLNLLSPWPMRGPFDMIFCRNVMIYFDKPTKQMLFEGFARLLQPGGWLYIGHSESLQGMTDVFSPAGRTIYRKAG